MAKTVVWTKRASIMLDKMLDYLETEFGKKAADNLTQKVFEVIFILSRSPKIGKRAGKSKSVRCFPIDKYRLIFYREAGKNLVVSAFFDQRQDPRKRPF